MTSKYAPNFPWDQFGVFKIIGKVRVLKLSQSAFLCSVSHMTTFFLNSRVWWISKIKRAKRLSQALVHLVIVRASRSWFKLWVMSEGRKHVPYVQCTMLFVQYDIQLWHGTLGVISHISKYSMFPMQQIISFDCSLNGLNAWFCFSLLSPLLDISIWMRLELTIQLGDCFLAGVILLLDGCMAIIASWSLFHRDRFPCTFPR